MKTTFLLVIWRDILSVRVNNSTFHIIALTLWCGNFRSFLHVIFYVKSISDFSSSESVILTIFWWCTYKSEWYENFINFKYVNTYQTWTLNFWLRICNNVACWINSTTLRVLPTLLNYWLQTNYLLSYSLGKKCNFGYSSAPQQHHTVVIYLTPFATRLHKQFIY